MKNYRLSDDIAFRFSNQGWSQYPLTAEKFDSWARDAVGDAPLLNLFMDYETFGEHQWADTGIFNFFEAFIAKWSESGNGYHTVTEAALSYDSAGEISMPDAVTWADSERDLSAWLGNDMQHEIAKHLYALENDVIRSGDEALIRDWRYLQSSDLLYYLSTKWLDDGDVHTYFSPYGSPYDAFLYYMNVIRDLRWRVMKHHNIGGING
jgi:alpha-amylase